LLKSVLQFRLFYGTCVFNCVLDEEPLLYSWYLLIRECSKFALKDQQVGALQDHLQQGLGLNGTAAAVVCEVRTDDFLKSLARLLAQSIYSHIVTLVLDLVLPNFR
jgi:hypothetical protein